MSSSAHSSTPSSLSLGLFLGPYNSGYSRIAKLLTSALPHTTHHVDGKLDLAPATVDNLGDHRNEFCMSHLVSTLLTQPGKIPLVSMGSGVMLDRKSNPALLSYMRTVFGPRTEFNITLYLPKVYDSDEPLLVLEGDEKDRFLSSASPLCADLRALYLSKAENPAEEKKRLEMHAVLQKLITSLADVCGKIVFFPTAVDEISELHKASLVESLRSLAPPRIEGKLHLVQKRFLTEHGAGEGRKVHHITVDFNSAGVPYTPPLSDPLQGHVGATVAGMLMTCPSTTLVEQFKALRSAASTINANASLHALIPGQLAPPLILEALEELSSLIELLMGNYSCLSDEAFVKRINTLIGKTFKIILEISRKNALSNELTAMLEDLERQKCLKVETKGQMIQFIVFPGLPGLSGLFEGELGTRAHITVNYGPHKPADMRTAAQFVYSGAETIRIDACEYRYNAGQDVPVDILRIYYI
jgi:hypothetical protein